MHNLIVDTVLKCNTQAVIAYEAVTSCPDLQQPRLYL